MCLLWAAVSALLLSLPGALLHVAVPENVSVECGDQRPLVSWAYSSQQPTIFTVQLLGSEPNKTLQTADHELDLSPLVWSRPTMAMEYLYVAVTAEQGPDRSKPNKSSSFSYNRLKTVAQTCHLTFPPVNLTRAEAGATLSLENPLYFYKELREIQNSAVFDLDVITESEHLQKRRCSGKQICKFSVDLPEDAEPCVNLAGVIKINLGSEINVQHNGPVCVTPPTDNLWLFTILFVVIFICVISLLTVAVCKYRAWAFPKIPTPQALNVPSFPSIRPSTSQPDTLYSPVQISEPRPRSTQDPESPPEFRRDRDQLPLLPGEPREDHDESGESTKTETLSLHSLESETEESVYERRAQIMEMDLCGDLVSGYTG